MPEPETPLCERPWENVERMLGVDDALERILSAFAPLDAVEVPLLEALGQVLAEAIVADEDVPPFRNSAMDGYAVRAADTAGASVEHPIHLRVTGETPAGSPLQRTVAPGCAVRIMTGAAMPDGADAVVRFEETDEPERPVVGDLNRESPSMVGVTRPAKPWDNVRPAGEDVGRGALVLPTGTRLRPAEIGLLAALNRPTVTVHRRPRVGILSTGDEIVDLGPPLSRGQIRNSNSYTVAAMVQRLGGKPSLLGVARDSVGALRAKLAEGWNADLIVTSGGVSLGDYDVVKDVLQAEGEIAIWQVRMKPGKPLAFGHVRGTPLLGLPGNPVAAAVSFEQFGRPALLKMLGRQDWAIPTVEATVAERLDNRGQRRHFVRVALEYDGASYVARSAGEQGAGVLTSLVRSDGLLVVPEHLEVVEPGTRLPVQMVDWGL